MIRSPASASRWSVTVATGATEGTRPVAEVAYRPLTAFRSGRAPRTIPRAAAETLLAYRQWAEHAGSQARALVATRSWTPGAALRAGVRAARAPRLPGAWAATSCWSRSDASGCTSCSADSLHLAAGRGAGPDDPTTLAAKRIFGDRRPALLERRAAAFARAVGAARRARPGLRQLGRRRARHPRLQARRRRPCAHALERASRRV